MTRTTIDFESGSNGTAVSTSTGFSSVVKGTGATFNYATGSAVHGSLGGQLSLVSGGAGYGVVTVAPASASTRTVVRFNATTTTGTVTQRLVEFRTASASAGYFGVNPAGKFSFHDSPDSVITSSTAANPGTTVRIELAHTPGTTTTSGVVEVNVYSTADGSTTLWSQTITGANLGSAALASLRFGSTASPTAAYTVNYDDIVTDDAMASGFIGPVVNQGNASLNVAASATDTVVVSTTANSSVNLATTATDSGALAVAHADSSIQLATTATAATVVSSTANATIHLATTATDTGANAPTTAIVGALLSTTAAATSFVPAGYLNPFKIDVYDKALAWQQSIGDPVHATFTPRVVPAVGTAEIEVRATDSVNEWLQTDGARIHVIYRGEHLFSGPVVSYQGDVIPGGTVTYQFEDDSRLLAQTLGWVAPTGHLTATSTSDVSQTTPEQAASYQGYYDWGGARSVETAIKQIVGANFSRLGRNVTIATDQGRGGTVAQSNLPQVRFDTLDTVVGKLLALSNAPMIAGMYQTPGSTQLTFQVYMATTWPQVLTYESGVLTKGTYSMQAPAATRVVVGGPGQDTARAFQAVNDSTGLEATYGQVVEVFTDSTSSGSLTWPDAVADANRQERYYPVTPGVASADITAFVNSLISGGQTALANGAPTSGIDIQLNETPGFHFGGSDGFHAGDTVTVGASGATFTEQITECTLAWTTDNFTVSPTLGQQTNDPDVILLQAVQLLATRLRQQGTGR